MRAERFCHHIDIDKQVVNVGHQAAHRTQPHMVMRIHQARHHDMAAGINHLRIVGGKVFPHGGNTIVLNQHIATDEVGHAGVQRQDSAAFKKGAPYSHNILLKRDQESGGQCRSRFGAHNKLQRIFDKGRLRQMIFAKNQRWRTG